MRSVFLFLLIVSYSSGQNFSQFIEYNKLRDIFADFNFFDLLTENKADISEECQAQLDKAQSKEKWVYQMADAWGKIPPGILSGNVVEFGHYDECIGINVVSDDIPIIGKYCTKSLKLSVKTNEEKEILVSLSLCIPDKCDPLTLLGENGEIEKWGMKITYTTDNTFCHTIETNSKLDGYDWAFIGVIIFVCVLMVLCTIAEAYYRHHDKHPPHPSLLAFSVIRNGERIFSYTKKTDKTQCLCGIKVLGLMSLVMYHRFSSMMQLPLLNMNEVLEFKDSINSAYIKGAKISIDTFFFISGYYCTYLQFRNMETQPLTLKTVPIFYFVRIFMLTPALAAMFFLQVTFLINMGNGPIWHSLFQATHDKCSTNWASFFFYYQNYNNPHELCVLPTWFLSADMQLYVVTPFILLAIINLRNKNKIKQSYAVLGVLLLISIIIPMIVELTFDNDNEFGTHMRLSIYCMGLIFGVFIHDVREGRYRIKISYFLNVFIWGLTFAVMIGCALYTWEAKTHHTYLKTNLFNTFSRPIWGLAIGWIIYACTIGKGGVVNWLLTQHFFEVLSRISFTMFILHDAIISLNLSYTRTSIHASNFEVLYLWCGDFLFTILLSLFWSLAFELPMHGLLPLIFGVEHAPPPKDLKKSDDLEVVTAGGSKH